VAAIPSWWKKLFKFQFASRVSSSNMFEFDYLPTHKVARYKNRPDLQWFYK
jgi:hypothetical protein